MKILVDKKTKVLIYVSEIAEIRSNGIFVGDCIFAEKNSIDIFDVFNIPQYVEPQKYCYNENDGFYPNEDYEEYLSLEEKFEQLKNDNDVLKQKLEEESTLRVDIQKELKLAQSAINDLILGGM